MRVFVVIALVQVSYVRCASISNRADQCDESNCTVSYAPVCGTDGKTYSSPCQLDMVTCNDASVTLAHKGPCAINVEPPHCPSCITLWDPVCGSDGTTCGNECQLQAAKCSTDYRITLAHNGECTE